LRFREKIGNEVEGLEYYKLMRFKDWLRNKNRFDIWEKIGNGEEGLEYYTLMRLKDGIWR
jgi:hypothetical protein